MILKVVKTQKKTSKPGVSTSARDSPVSKPMKADPPQMLQPFKRPEAIKVANVPFCGKYSWAIEQRPESINRAGQLSKDLS